MRRLVDSPFPAAYAPSGHVLFIRDRVLFAQSLDPTTWKLTGRAYRVADEVVLEEGAPASVSANGTVVYRGASSGGGRQLTWFDRSGKVLSKVGSPDRLRVASSLSLARDGRRVALIRELDGNRDVWVADLERGGALMRVTVDGASESGPLWTPDGRRMVFDSRRNGPLDLYQRRMDASEDEPLLRSSQNKRAADWSPDGSVLL